MSAPIMEPKALEDPALVRATLAGEQAAFQRLVERYQGRIFALIRHYIHNPVEVEDLAQDTFLKAFRRLDSFQSQSSFYTWLYRIGVNTVLDYLKRKGRNPVTTVEDPELGQGDASPVPGAGARVGAPDARLEEQDVARVTREVLDDLPEIFRTVLILREFEELAYQDIADTLGISIGTVESRLFRARARFKERLIQIHPEYAL